MYIYYTMLIFINIFNSYIYQTIYLLLFIFISIFSHLSIYPTNIYPSIMFISIYRSIYQFIFLAELKPSHPLCCLASTGICFMLDISAAYKRTSRHLRENLTNENKTQSRKQFERVRHKPTWPIVQDQAKMAAKGGKKEEKICKRQGKKQFAARGC